MNERFKLLETEQETYFGEVVAKIANEISHKYHNDSKTPLNREQYFSLNRAIGDVISSRFKKIGFSQQISREEFLNVEDNKLQQYKNSLIRSGFMSMGEEIFSSGNYSAEERINPFTGNFEVRCYTVIIGKFK